MLPTFDVPPIGPRQGKVWGVTQMVFALDCAECHVASIKAGGFSSRHYHKIKWNRFVLLSGELVVRTYHENGLVDATVLRPGFTTDVPPGALHEFEAIQDSELLEIYWVSLSAGDIERGESHGGMKEQSTTI